MAEQYTETRRSLKRTKNGEMVIVDPSRTYQKNVPVVLLGRPDRVTRGYFDDYPRIQRWLLGSIPASFGPFVIGIVVLLVGRKRYVIRPPGGSVLWSAIKVFRIARRNRWNMEAAKAKFEAHIWRNSRDSLERCLR